MELAPEHITDLLAVHARFPERYPHLLASHGEAEGRYDILFAYPKRCLTLGPRAGLAECAEFFRNLDQHLSARVTHACEPAKLPFLYGYFLYFSYELIAGFEPRLARLKRPSLPLAWVQEFDGAVIRDHKTKTSYVTARNRETAGAIRHDLQGIGTQDRDASDCIVRQIEEDDPREFLEKVGAVKRYIAAGDIFQANLSRGYRAHISGQAPALALMRALTIHNSAPFSALAHIGSATVISASPERLMAIQEDRIVTRPIAGTSARFPGSEDDENARQTLWQHPKERAEHIMLVDLERNDIGRLCIPGTIRVTKLMDIESYATVHHLVSTIEGQLRPDIRFSAILSSLFPGGSITGCPKLRSLEILSELEPAARGPYTGSLGYVNEDGNIDLNILIRTIVMVGERLEWRVGGGIVMDSDPQQELEETRAKAAGLLRALHA